MTWRKRGCEKEMGERGRWGGREMGKKREGENAEKKRGGDVEKKRWVGCGDGAPNVTPDKPCCRKDVTLVERNDASSYTAAGMNCLVGGLRIA